MNLVNETVSEMNWKYNVLEGTFAFMNSPVAPPVVLTPQKSLFPWISDGHLALLCPVVAYWTLSMIFHALDTFKLAEQYRIHPSKEVASRNKASRLEVLREVIFQHFLQTVTGIVFVYYDKVPMTGFEAKAMWDWRRTLPSFVPNDLIYFGYMYGFPLFKVIIGFGIIDSWQYWLHRLMHVNKTLYKLYHSRHHRLYVPYAYGALYNAPTEGFLLDTCGTGLAALLTGITPREQILLFTFATMKTVDDHCGYALPWDPFQWLFPNNAVYHDIHHQQFGIKTNFAQPFFTFWDSFCNTKYEGLAEYEHAQRRITIDRYKKFLGERENEKAERIKKGFNVKKDE
ncbi:LAMI_0D04324g1_1 [Lachancea mirantina]|uniref:LAMI_0D04324g1_1 n=1 Tax=Lachancea mirantina TaxID=1230905 RepID=A0A1G4JAZ8_9SACH|nr:LAMI_0D04324g1_1 [Lachancea mirantina]